MKISMILESIVRYVTEAFARIFSKADESPPEIGVQPYDCELYRE